MPTPDVSVVITCYNYARYVGEAARSVLTQEGVDLELIIVDDASTDDSLEVIGEIAETDERVRVVALPANSGAARAFNASLAQVRGRAWVRLDADDLLTPGSLRRGLDVLDAEPRVGLVYGLPQPFIDDDVPARSDTAVTTWSVWRGTRWLEGRLRDPRSVITSVEAMARTAATDEVGGMSPLRNAHDLELWLRIASRWEVARIDGVHQGMHRVHAGSLSEAHMSDPLLGARKRVLVFDAYVASGFAPTALAGKTQKVRRLLVRNALDSVNHLWDRGRAGDGLLARAMRDAREHVADAPRLPEYRAAAARNAADPAHPLWRLTSFVAAGRRRVRQEAEMMLLRRTGVLDLRTAAARETRPAVGVSAAFREASTAPSCRG